MTKYRFFSGSTVVKWYYRLDVETEDISTYYDKEWHLSNVPMEILLTFEEVSEDEYFLDLL